MSENFFKSDDTAWGNFISTGSIYDYLEYKSKVGNVENNVDKAIFKNNCGGFCENRSERTGNQRG